MNCYKITSVGHSKPTVAKPGEKGRVEPRAMQTTETDQNWAVINLTPLIVIGSFSLSSFEMRKRKIRKNILDLDALEAEQHS
jgi:hypothetical protein